MQPPNPIVPHCLRRLAPHCAARAWLAAAGGMLAILAAPQAEASTMLTCPAVLPAQVDPRLWSADLLERGHGTRLREIQWAADQAPGSVGRVQCHYDATDYPYWGHPVLSSVFEVREPDPAAWPGWHRVDEAANRWLCSGATEVVFDTRDCPFEALGLGADAAAGDAYAAAPP